MIMMLITPHSHVPQVNVNANANANDFALQLCSNFVLHNDDANK